MATTDLRDYELSLRRTIVPVLVGIVLAQAARANLTLPADHVAGLLEAAFISVYYTVARALEMRFPQAGALLGALVQPSYGDE